MDSRLSKIVLACMLALALGACANQQPATQSDAPLIEPVWRADIRERAIEMLLEASTSPDPLVRANAIEGLQDAPFRARVAVEQGLTDENLGVRFASAVVAGRLEMADLRGWVQPLLNDPALDVRAAAIYAMARFGVEVDPTPLAEMLLQGSVRTRAQAAFILGEIGNPSASPLLQEAARQDIPRATLNEIRILDLQIAEAMVKLGDLSALEPIRAALYPSRPEELEATALAVQVIGHVEDRRSIDQLIYLTEANDDDAGGPMPAEIRLAAAASLAQLGLPRGSFIADLYARDRMATLRSQAAYVYGQAAAPGNLRKLAAMLEDPSPMVQVAAAAAVLAATRDVVE